MFTVNFNILFFNGTKKSFNLPNFTCYIYYLSLSYKRSYKIGKISNNKTSHYKNNNYSVNEEQTESRNKIKLFSV